jgi:hypothetical protein
MLLRWNPSTHCTHTPLSDYCSSCSMTSPTTASLQWSVAEDFAGNDGLCGVPLDRRCKKRFRLRIWLGLRRVNDASSNGAVVGTFLFCGGVRRYQSCLRVCDWYVRESWQHSLPGIILDDLNRVKCQFTQGLLLMFQSEFVFTGLSTCAPAWDNLETLKQYKFLFNMY